MEETLTIVPMQFEKVVQSKTYSCIVLSNEERKFGIFSSTDTGQLIQQHLTDSHKPRPMTHDLLNGIFRGLDVRVKHVVINDLQDTVYFARLFLEQQVGEMTHIVEIDARPSDCITLSIIYKAPIYCTTDVLDRTLPYCD